MQRAVYSLECEESLGRESNFPFQTWNSSFGSQPPFSNVGSFLDDDKLLNSRKNYHKMKGSQTNLQTTGGQGPPEIPCFLFSNSHADTAYPRRRFFFFRFKPLPGGLIFWGPPKEGDGKKTSRRKKRSGCAELARARKEGFLALPVSWLEKRGVSKWKLWDICGLDFLLEMCAKNHIFSSDFWFTSGMLGFKGSPKTQQLSSLL